jgi:hypothetical protein
VGKAGKQTAAPSVGAPVPRCSSGVRGRRCAVVLYPTATRCRGRWCGLHECRRYRTDRESGQRKDHVYTTWRGPRGGISHNPSAITTASEFSCRTTMAEFSSIRAIATNWQPVSDMTASCALEGEWGPRGAEPAACRPSGRVISTTCSRAKFYRTTSVDNLWGFVGEGISIESCHALARG